MKTVRTIGITEENYQALRKQAADFGLSVEDMVNQAISTYIKVSEAEPKKDWPANLRLKVTQKAEKTWWVEGKFQLDADRMLVVGQDYRFDDYYADDWDGAQPDVSEELLYEDMNKGFLDSFEDIDTANITQEEADFIIQQIKASQWTK